MCRHRGVNYGGNHITIYIHITRCTVQSTMVHLKLTQYHVSDVLRIRKKRAREERRGKEEGQVSWKIDGLYSFKFEEFV